MSTPNTDGRTVWWAKDAGWWRRESVVTLGEEFGPGGPAVVDWLACEAKAQNAGGWVLTGYRSIARGCFLPDAETACHVVSRAVTLCLLDELTEPDGRIRCRISGWSAEQERGAAAARKAAQRAREAAENSASAGLFGSTTSKRPKPLSRSVTPRPKKSPTGQDSSNTPLPPGGEKTDVVEDVLPADLPTQLYATALAVHATLSRIAAAKPGARPVTLAAVGRAVQSFPDHDLVQIAGDSEHYWCHGLGQGRGMKDVVQTFRNRLRDIPAVPASARPSATVHRIDETTEQRHARLASEAAARNARVYDRASGHA
jgi:hypothetical protein